MAYRQTAKPEGSLFVLLFSKYPDGRCACPPHRNFTSPHSDGEAFSLPATAHGLQGRFNARTVTERKYQGSCTLSGRPATVRLRHGPCRSCRSRKIHFLPVTAVMAGLSLGTFTLRIRVFFYSVFKLREGLSLPRANVARGITASHKPFHFCPVCSAVSKNFFDFFRVRSKRV